MKKILFGILFLFATVVKAQNIPIFDSKQLIDVGKVASWNFASRPEGWYRIASRPGGYRPNSIFELRDNANHTNVRFEIGVSFNYKNGASFTLTSNSYYFVPTFRKVRLLTSGIYDETYVEVYLSPINNDGSTFNAYLINPLADGDWVIQNWTSGSIPSGYAVTEWDLNAAFNIGSGNGNSLSVLHNGNVGIGTTSPGEKLVVYGNVNATGGILSLESSRNDLQYVEVGAITGKNGGNEIARMGLLRGAGSTTGFLNFMVKATNETPVYEAMRITPEGNLGIGTSSPSEKLSVNGKIRAHEIKVETTGWPDYVFEEGYQKTSIAELEKYIRSNKHLPDMPPARDVQQHGVALGELGKQLLKNQEELTLHLIEQNKKINELLKLVAAQQEEIEQLKIMSKK